MSTPYSEENGTYTALAHHHAKRWIYPALFAPAAIRRISTPRPLPGEKVAHLDAEKATDRLVTVESPLGPLTIPIQERFRRPSYADFRDITITEFNHATGVPSEFSKLHHAGLFVYGYTLHESIDALRSTASCPFLEVIVVNICSMFCALARGHLPYGLGMNPRSAQDFVTIGFDALHAARCVVRHFDFRPQEDEGYTWDDARSR